MQTASRYFSGDLTPLCLDGVYRGYNFGAVFFVIPGIDIGMTQCPDVFADIPSRYHYLHLMCRVGRAVYQRYVNITVAVTYGGDIYIREGFHREVGLAAISVYCGFDGIRGDGGSMDGGVEL